MKKVFALSLIALFLAGCNTISGVGRDVQRAGQIVTGAGGK
ncbi:entericidin A/B family lipoprotein [Massilia soli]|uniref:Type IV secretion system putative lipoprotein virB7 n=1 Tax=Massilia soli TaxID=2792854 RepID=A0ABS7SRI7_9BURK|nr:entericidin A/B family lipoprotein [Massilia soli]MBZ2208569.1 entericidin A/B family lipoprotein [Massilia soli]